MSERFAVPCDPRSIEFLASRRALLAEEPEPVDEEPEPPEPEPDPNALTLHQMLALIPPIEAHILLSHLGGRSQSQLAIELKVYKNTIAHRLRRARERLVWLREWPGLRLTTAEVQSTCKRCLPPVLRREVLAYWPKGSGRAPTLRAIGTTRGVDPTMIHRRLQRAVSLLVEHAATDETAATLAAALLALQGSSILRERGFHRYPRIHGLTSKGANDA